MADTRFPAAFWVPLPSAEGGASPDLESPDAVKQLRALAKVEACTYAYGPDFRRIADEIEADRVRCFWPASWRLSRAERLVSEAAKMYRLDDPSPEALQEYLNEAAELLAGLLKDVEAAHEGLPKLEQSE